VVVVATKRTDCEIFKITKNAIMKDEEKNFVSKILEFFGTASGSVVDISKVKVMAYRNYHSKIKNPQTSNFIGFADCKNSKLSIPFRQSHIAS
jgi:hypothetical protein